MDDDGAMNFVPTHSLLAALLCLGMHTPPTATTHGAETQPAAQDVRPALQASQAIFEALLPARNAEFVRLRTALLADPAAVAYLPRRFHDDDPVTAFVARQLFDQARPGRLAELEAIENSLQSTIDFLHAKASERNMHVLPMAYQTALHAISGRPDQGELQAHFLFRMLMEPKVRPQWVDGLVSQGFVYDRPKDLEVFLRALLDNDRDDWRNHDEWLRDFVFVHFDRRRVARALERERLYALKKGLAYPVTLKYPLRRH